MIRVAIVTESAEVRAGVADALAGEPDVHVDVVDASEMEHDVGQALASHDHIDVLVWVPSDDELRERGRWHDDADLDGRPSRVPMVILLERMDADIRRELYAGGANAVLPYDVPSPELVAALRAAAARLVVMQAGVSSELGRGARHRADASVALTPREHEVLTLLARGLANKAMASQLGITEHTVKTHVAAVYDKLGAGNRAEAVVAAARQGLIMI